MSRRQAPRLDKTIGGLSSTFVTHAASDLGLTPGAIAMPTGFAPELPCTFTRESDGSITHDMDFGQYLTGTTIYVDTLTGNDTTGTGASGAPYRSLGKAFDIAIAGAGDYVISTNDVLDRTYGLGATKTITGKRVSLIGRETGRRTKVTTANAALSWSAAGSGTWVATRSAVYSVFDVANVDADGLPVPLTAVASAAACQAAAGSWYTDNTSVWVHPTDGLVPTVSTHHVCVAVTLMTVNLASDATLYFQDIEFISGSGGDAVLISGDANVQGTLVAQGSAFIGGHLRASGATGNTLSSVNVKNTYLFDCISAYGSRDGLNYHYGLIPGGSVRSCLAMEFGCLSRNHGAYDTNANNNTTTCHEGASILRIGTEGHTSTGPVLADVNGCFSVCIDCNIHDATANTLPGYLFSDAGGEAWVINCKGGGLNQYDLQSNGDEVNIVGRFKGHKISATKVYWH